MRVYFPWQTKKNAMKKNSIWLGTLVFLGACGIFSYPGLTHLHLPFTAYTSHLRIIGWVGQQKQNRNKEKEKQEKKVNLIGY